MSFQHEFLSFFQPFAFRCWIGSVLLLVLKHSPWADRQRLELGAHIKEAEKNGSHQFHKWRPVTHWCQFSSADGRIIAASPEELSCHSDKPTTRWFDAARNRRRQEGALCCLTASKLHILSSIMRLLDHSGMRFIIWCNFSMIFFRTNFVLLWFGGCLWKLAGLNVPNALLQLLTDSFWCQPNAWSWGNPVKNFAS